jgi:hypothetical protein
MSGPRSSKQRLVPVVGAIVAALVLALVGAHVSGAGAAGSSHQVVTKKELQLRNEMRRLWEEHVTWTRLVIVSFDADLPDLAATEQRLLQNQKDIGEATEPFYGEAAATQLTHLLRRHILIAVRVLAAAKAGDQAALDAAQARWHRNARQIARFPHNANPKNWPLREMRRMMNRHLALTTQEAVDHLTGHFQSDVRDYDRVEHEILQMADMLSTGIIAQFPGGFD